MARVSYLDGPRLRRCLLSGLHRLIAEREYLNDINVYPVPDADTGNNLAHTAKAGITALLKLPSPKVGKTLTELANAMLDEGQGYSGILLARYMTGLAEATQTADRLSTSEMAVALASAKELEGAKDEVSKEIAEGAVTCWGSTDASCVTSLTSRQ